MRDGSIPRRLLPLVQRGKRFFAESAVGGCLVPADVRHRIVVSTLRVVLTRPAPRAGKPCPVPKFAHRLVPGEHQAVFGEGMLPVLLLEIPSGDHEFLELSVGHLEPIHEKVVELHTVVDDVPPAHDAVLASRNEAHPLRHVP